jgi:hypothetical protein
LGEESWGKRGSAGLRGGRVGGLEEELELEEERIWGTRGRAGMGRGGFGGREEALEMGDGVDVF